MVISSEAGCPYCVTAHAAALRLRTKDAALVDRLAVNYRHVDLPREDRVMLDFAVKLTHAPETCDEDDVAGLRAASFSDADILHLVEVVAIFNYQRAPGGRHRTLPECRIPRVGPWPGRGRARHATGRGGGCDRPPVSRRGMECREQRESRCRRRSFFASCG